MSNGFTTREDLRREIGHFISGEATSAGGKPIVAFTVKFLVTDEVLAKLNDLISGIRYCEKVFRPRANKYMICVQIASSQSQNEVIKIALLYRNKVNSSFVPPSVTPTKSAADKRRVREAAPTRPLPKPPLSAQLNFSGMPPSSRK